MVAQNTVRTYGKNQVSRFVAGNWLHHFIKRDVKFGDFFRKRPIYSMCSIYFELPPYISTMIDIYGEFLRHLA